MKTFKLTKPCANCPFRNDDKAIKLRPGRRQEIMTGLLTQEHSAFHCHKTLPEQLVCAGAAAVCQKHGRDMQVVQIATRLGLIAPDYYEPAHALTVGAGDYH